MKDGLDALPPYSKFEIFFSSQIFPSIGKSVGHHLDIKIVQAFSRA